MATKKAKRAKPDWEEIKELYRANIVSLRVIASKFSITEGAIRKKAKAEGWKRDLADKVRKATKEKLVRSEGTQKSTQHSPKRTDEEIIEEKADMIVSIVRDHQRTIKSGRKIVTTLLSELLDVSQNRAEIEKTIEIETQDDKDSKRRNSMLKAVSISARAGVVLNLSAAMKNLIALERQAFNMDAEADTKEGSYAQLVLASMPGSGVAGHA
jgi:hypothetical protein